MANPQSAMWMDMGLGKLQPDSEPVLTPDGWVPIGDLQVGDQVIGADGKPTRVAGVYPHGKQDIYRVTMNDGSATRCGLDHLWRVYTPCQKQRGKPGRVLTLREILDEGITDPSGNRRHHIPTLSMAVSHPVAEVLIEPYLLGVLLGDGHIGLVGAPSITSDDEILQDWAGRIEEHPSTGISTLHLIKNDALRRALNTYGLRGKRSWEKHIPDEYLIGADWQRLSLLQGLLDTDGSWCRNGILEFSSTSENLADGVVALTQSLGGIARKSGPRRCRHQNGIGRDSWRVNVKLPETMPPFRLSRKLAKWVPPTKYPPARLIASVERVGQEPATCIAVDAADNLYVTKDYIVTHNTVVSLSLIAQRMNQLQVFGTLVVAPLRVCQTVWAQEAKKWSHTGHLSFSLVHGSPQERERAILRRADVYLINYENVVWLVQAIERLYLAQGKYPPFNFLVADESSKLKNASTKRHKALQRLVPYIPYRVGLTGTPAANGYLDLFGQYLMLDGGARLGHSKKHFEEAYFTTTGFTHKKFEINEASENAIKHAISDITLQMSAEEYLELPEVIINDIGVTLPPEAMAQYDKMEAEMFLELDGIEIEVFNAAAKTNKLLQLANGAAYIEAGNDAWVGIHQAKLEAMDDIIEESAGSPVLCFYEFRSDAARIKERYPDAVFLKGGMTTKATEDLVASWNRKEIPLLVAHPASAAHGLNLQYGGHMLIWFGLNWSLELYMQANARLDRQGQTKPVIMHRILAKGTMDYAVSDALAQKGSTQSALRDAIKNYRRTKYGK